MDNIRSETHANYVQAKADLESGLSGVRKAMRVLRDYYGSDAVEPAMLQQPTPPEQHEKAAGAGWSVIETLEVVEADFAKGLATEELQEADAQADYERTTPENAITKTLKDQDVKYKGQASSALDKTIGELSGDRESTNAELSAVLEYYAKLKERCIAKPETYEARRGRR